MEGEGKQPGLTEARRSNVHRRGQRGEEWQEAAVLTADALDNHGAMRRRCVVLLAVPSRKSGQSISTRRSPKAILMAASRNKGRTRRRFNCGARCLRRRSFLGAEHCSTLTTASNLAGSLDEEQGGGRGIPQGFCDVAAETPGRAFAA